MRGFDQATNLILDESHERVFSPEAGVEQVVLGLYIIRGDNMCARTPRGEAHPIETRLRARARHRAIIGELDEEQDARRDLSAIRADPLAPVVH